MLIYILIVNVLLAFKLWWDYRAKKRGRIINHTRSAIIDTLIYIVAAWYFLCIDAGAWILTALGYRWIMFDIIFNRLNGWEWNHYGESSMIDKFMIKTGKWHIVIKLAFFLAGTALIIFT